MPGALEGRFVRRRRPAAVVVALGLLLLGAGPVMTPAAADPVGWLPGPPAVTASASPIGGPIPLNVTFSATGSSGSPPYSFVWSFGDGTGGVAGGAVYHIYRFWGVFQANVTLTDSLSDTAGASVNVTVTPAALVIAAQPSRSSVAVGGIVLLETSVAGGAPPYSYVWYGLPAGCPIIGAENLSCQVTASGMFNVTVAVTDTLGTVASASFELTVTGGSPLPPPAEASPDPLYLFVIVGLAIAAAVVGLLVGVRWRRRRPRG